MATGHQMTLARHRAPIVQKTARSQVPAFLQKLYEMLNDPNNFHLIRWSEAGDSFIVPNHEQFAREVLGRWFKHQNFHSFVRQLNMYGFHKIPQLQQGVLKSESDLEIWNFAHPHFRRGEPHLLNFIQRKRQATQGEGALDGVTPGAGVISTLDFHDPTNGPSGGATTSGPVLDIQSIMNGISTIKRHQSSIQAELSDIKQTNQLLWQDAMDVRTKYQKQQDTINRIVKFLAGVFGSHASPHKDDGMEALNTRSVIPRQRIRLMLEDGKTKKAGVTEVQEEEEEDRHEAMETQFLVPGEIYETPVTEPSPAPSDNTSTFTTETPSHFNSYNFSQPQTQSTTPSGNRQLPLPLPPPYPQPQQPAQTNQQHSQTQQLSDPADHTVTTPSRSPNPSQSFDIQHALSQLTPQQISQLLSVTFSPFDTSLPDSHGAAPIAPSSQLTSYQPPPFDFSHLTQPCRDEDEQDLISFDSATPGLERQWKVTDDLGQEVNMLDSSIHSFMQEMQDMGLDPRHILDSGVGAMVDSNQQQPSLHPLNLPPSAHLLSHPPQPTTPTPTPASPSSLLQMPSSVPLSDPPNTHDADFDEMYSFLNLGRDGGLEDDVAGGDPSTAFLDGVQVLPELDERASASPVSSKQAVGKRKSDVPLSEVQMEAPAPPPPPAPEPAPRQPPKRGGVKMNMNSGGTTTRPAKRRRNK